MNKSQLLDSLKREGISRKVLDAFSKVKREDFVPEFLKEKVYEDIPLPIGKEQTISQPYTIAIMLDLLDLKKSQKVLELGSGSGYVLALISNLVGDKGKVYGVERIKELANKSKVILKQIKNISVYNQDGKKGLKEKAPFDRILISAACETIPRASLSQLKNKGLLIAPVGHRYEQSLVIIQRIGNEFKIKKKIPGFVFVPFV